MDYSRITDRYYADWLGVSSDAMHQDGIRVVKSDQRAVRQKGYPTRFDLYVYVQDERVIISYHDRAERRVDALRGSIRPGDRPERIVGIVGDAYGITPSRHIKFVFHHLAHSDTLVKELTPADYPAYLRFFMMNNPEIKDVGWLHGYFQEAAKRRVSYGVMVDDLLVAATDAPHMPYMEDEVQEIGINTLSEHRGNGYARAACIAAADSLIRQGICPQWSTAAGNIASERLAYSVGFKRLAEVVAVGLR